MSIRYFCSLYYLLHSGVFDSECDVVVECIIEEYSLLVYITHIAAEVVYLQLADIYTVNGNTSFVYIVKAWYQVRKR